MVFEVLAASGEMQLWLALKPAATWMALSKAVDRMATAEAATKLDDNLMTVSSQIQAGCAIPIRPRYHGYSFFRTSASQGS
jgi:hypothetical protein